MSQVRTGSHMTRLGRLAFVGASLLLVGGAFAACGKTPISDQPLASSHAGMTKMMTIAKPSSAIHLTIVAQRPGSSVDGPAYTPSTNLTLPANSTVTITIVNADPGDTSLPAGSPFGKVTGVIGGQASVDGIGYSQLALDKVAHTFTVPSLGVNVPIPGDVPAGKSTIAVTFSFKTGAAGTYMWQCMDPCGGDPNGWGGPMAMRGYMMGTITVVG